MYGVMYLRTEDETALMMDDDDDDVDSGGGGSMRSWWFRVGAAGGRTPIRIRDAIEIESPHTQACQGLGATPCPFLDPSLPQTAFLALDEAANQRRYPAPQPLSFFAS